MQLPSSLKDRDAFAERMTAIFGERTEQILQNMSTPPQWSAYWRNPLRAQDHAQFEPMGEPLGPLPGVWLTEARHSLTHSEVAKHGQIYIQNPSSVLAVRVLDPQPDEEILDLAAAPGGKSIACAAAMDNRGRLAVVEPIKKRFHQLKANLERCGVTISACYLRDGRGVGRAVGERFDRVLLDAPCSSEGRINWSDPSTYHQWSMRKVKECQRKQKSLLRSAFAALKPGGVLVYCTCSLGPDENELVVAHLLQKTDAEVINTLSDVVELGIDVQAGCTTWAGKALPAALAGTVRVVPKDPWAGFYIAKLVKPGESPQ